MDLGVAQTLAVTSGSNDLAKLGKVASTPEGAGKAAQQFGALMMENLMRQSDGTALPLVGGAGSDVVNQMFAGTIGRAVMANEKMGLTDLLLRSIEKKQQQANGAADGGPSPAASTTPAATAGSFPLAAYWQGNGLRPLAAAIARGGVSPGAGAALALMSHMNPKLAALFGAGGNPQPQAVTTPSSAGGHATGGASAEEIAAFSQKLMPLLQQAGQQLGISPKILLAQAAIETGWGRSVVGNNMFGIKAGSSWTGQKIAAATHEYQNGELVSITDAFRAYPSIEASVQDFVSLVANSPRYHAALGSGDNAAAYAQNLISGGWATDINYVHKLQSVAANPAVNAAIALTPPQPVSAPSTTQVSAPGQPISLLPVNFALPAHS